MITRNRVRARLGRLGWHLASGAAAALFLLPLVWMASGSLRQPGLPPPRALEWLPTPAEWANYRRIFELLPLGRYLLNSVVVAGLAVPITLLAASWAGFALAQMSTRAQPRLVLLALALLLVPITALWLARMALFNWLGWVDSYAALLAPALMGTSPLFVLLFYWAFRRQPAELVESARLDGAGAFAIWWSVALPLARSTVVAVALLTVLVYWSDFINPLLYLRSQHLYTLPVGVQQLQQHDRGNWPLLMAAAVVMATPAVLLFAAVQRYFLGQDGLVGEA
ncbi:MAG: carbohydrate ABC transporter permease [Anaerolineales bacterium]|nr:carbohydrate ABC transporter permease [Anaerolineales bacterium]